jgi:hypothetical protein
VTPHLALADEFDIPEPETAPAAAASEKRKSSANQELAEDVAKALRKAQLSKHEIDIDVRSGVVTLIGTIAKPEQRAAAGKVVSSVPGVTRVINRLEVVANYSKREVQQAVATMPRSPVGSSQYIRRTDGQRPANAGISPSVETAPYAEPARVAYAGPVQQQPVPAPQYYPPGSPASGQPNLPGNAYPAGAQYPNYAGVGYSGQQAASAYPYIGPFYPYPQIPLGWRKASLEWDDGYWNLNFRSRTDKWWWYLNPQNW